MTTPDLEETCRRIDARIGYLLPTSTINRRYCSPHADRDTGVNEMRDVVVRDGRPIREHFFLDTHGFTLADHRSAVRNFEDEGEVAAVYEPEAMALVKALTGADKVVALGSALRTAGDTVARNMRPPACEAHVDFHPGPAHAYARMTYEKAFPDGPGYSRFIATSLWRTFSPPPQDWPLAVCDCRSVGDDEGRPNVMVVCDEIPPEEELFAPIEGEDKLPAASIFPYNPAHRWWFFSGMTRDEALLFKFHDSDRSRAWRALHTSFQDTSAVGPNIRESIEFRSFAYFE